MNEYVHKPPISSAKYHKLMGQVVKRLRPLDAEVFWDDPTNWMRLCGKEILVVRRYLGYKGLTVVPPDVYFMSK